MLQNPMFLPPRCPPAISDPAVARGLQSDVCGRCTHGPQQFDAVVHRLASLSSPGAAELRIWPQAGTAYNKGAFRSSFLFHRSIIELALHVSASDL
jgi:hypothetical protein